MSDDNFVPNMSDDDIIAPFDVREQSGKRAMLLLVGAFAFLMILAIVFLKAFSNGTRTADDLPRIVAKKEPFKKAPENVGGTQTPNQDKDVYNAIDGANAAANNGVNLAPAPETPVELPKPKLEKPQIIIKQNGPIVKPNNPASTPISKPATPPSTRPIEAKKPRQTPAPAPRNTGSTTVRVGNSNFVVQVASVRSQEQAQNLWNEMTQKYPKILRSDFYADVRRVDLADKGIYYRIRVAGLAGKTDATNLCNALKQAGESCFVTSK